MKIKTAAHLGVRQLYHYQSFDKPERLTRIFADSQLYFSAPRDFNDPWDCRPCYDKSSLDDAGEYERVVQWFDTCGRTQNAGIPDAEHVHRANVLRRDRLFLERMIDELTTEMNQAIQDQYRVYCLTTHPDSTLMWAHYASSCRGICLEFSTRNELFCTAIPVEYLSRYPRFDVASVDDDANLMALLTKSDAWHYETEFRAIATEHPHTVSDVPIAYNGLVPLPKGALQAIIVGAQMPEKDRQIVRGLIRDSGWSVELKTARLVSDQYRFDVCSLK